MADNLEQQRRKKHKIDKNLKRARERFHSPQTRLALSQALSALPNLAAFDRVRITGQLETQLGQFKHFGAGVKHLGLFRAAVTDSATKQAHLVIRLREIATAMHIDDYVITLLLARLPEFRGNDLEFPAWVATTTKNERAGLDALAKWITRNRAAVYAGIWRVLKQCRDLDNCLDDIADCLSSEIWWYVANHATQFLDSPVPIHEQLESRAYWAARRWKTNRLNEIKNGERGKPSHLKPEELERDDEEDDKEQESLIWPLDSHSSGLMLGDLEAFDRPIDYENCEESAEECSAAWNDAEFPVAA